MDKEIVAIIGVIFLAALAVVSKQDGVVIGGAIGLLGAIFGGAVIRSTNTK